VRDECFLQNFLQNPEGETSLQKPRHSREDNIKITIAQSV
jgi:hypothetical protein